MMGGTVCCRMFFCVGCLIDCWVGCLMLCQVVLFGGVLGVLSSALLGYVV